MSPVRVRSPAPCPACVNAIEAPGASRDGRRARDAYGSPSHRSPPARPIRVHDQLTACASTHAPRAVPGPSLRGAPLLRPAWRERKRYWGRSAGGVVPAAAGRRGGRSRPAPPAATVDLRRCRHRRSGLICKDVGRCQIHRQRLAIGADALVGHRLRLPARRDRSALDHGCRHCRSMPVGWRARRRGRAGGRGGSGLAGGRRSVLPAGCRQQDDPGQDEAGSDSGPVTAALPKGKELCHVVILGWWPACPRLAGGGRRYCQPGDGEARAVGRRCGTSSSATTSLASRLQDG